MAGARQSKAAHRRDERTREAANSERITLITAGVLVAVAVILAAGVVWGIVLPPRAHIITVGSQEFTAADVEKRAVFLIAGGSASTADPVDAAVELIRRHETLLQLGAAEAGEITDDDLAKAIRKRLGVADDAQPDVYTKAYEDFLRGSNLDRATYERMVRADVIAERLAEQFRPQVGEAGLQLHLMGVASGDRAKLQQLRDAVAGGADFGTRAVELGLVQDPGTVDLGWLLPPAEGFYRDTVKLQDLPAGQVTEVIQREGTFQYEFYRVAERDEQRAYTDEHKKTLGARLVDEWVAKQQVERLQVTEDISDAERRWITKQVTAAAQDIAERRAAAGPVVTVTTGGN